MLIVDPQPELGSREREKRLHDLKCLYDKFFSTAIGPRFLEPRLLHADVANALGISAQ